MHYSQHQLRDEEVIETLLLEQLRPYVELANLVCEDHSMIIRAAIQYGIPESMKNKVNKLTNKIIEQEQGK